VPRTIHFEIHATDPERVQALYRTGETSQPGINGGMVRRWMSPTICAA
jgi:hypothetical protein